jgi:hypothetical protein
MAYRLSSDYAFVRSESEQYSSHQAVHREGFANQQQCADRARMLHFIGVIVDPYARFSTVHTPPSEMSHCDRYGFRLCPALRPRATESLHRGKRRSAASWTTLVPRKSITLSAMWQQAHGGDV